MAPHEYEGRATLYRRIFILHKTGVVKDAVVEGGEIDTKHEVVEVASAALSLQMEGVPKSQVDNL